MRTTIACDTPVGLLYVLVDDQQPGVTADGTRTPWAVVHTSFGAPTPDMDAVAQPRTAEALAVVAAVADWGVTGGDALDAVPVHQGGGPFQQRVWQALRTVAAGSTISYAALAAAAGNPRAMRAAGTAMATNAVAPFVPCHRVLRTGGDIGNYAWGVAMKRRLLELERAAGVR